MAEAEASARSEDGAAHRGEAERLRARLRAAAHEMRTPLTGAVAVADILANSDMPESSRAYVELLREAIQQVVAVANDILDVGRLEAELDLGGFETFSPGRLLAAITGLAQPRAEAKGLTLMLTTHGVPPFVSGHPVMLRRAVENLLDNALKHTRQGSVSVEAAWGEAQLTVEVRDTGDGISEADVPRLFKPYAQLESGQRAGGTGLGLSLVLGAVERMGGSVVVGRTPEGGACFRLTVPLTQSEAPSPAHRTDLKDGRSLSVLVAEDNPINRLVSGTILREFGHRVAFAPDGGTAVEAASTGRYDLVLMDLELPGIDGPAALHRIRALHDERRDTPVIAVSARGEQGRADSLAEGFDAYVSKPIDPNALFEAILGAVR